MAYTVQGTKDEAVDHIEKVEHGLGSPSASSSQTFDTKLVAKIRHRIDWRLIPALGAMYGTLTLRTQRYSQSLLA
jgi:hypothetical protein